MKLARALIGMGLVITLMGTMGFWFVVMSDTKAKIEEAKRDKVFHQANLTGTRTHWKVNGKSFFYPVDQYGQVNYCLIVEQDEDLQVTLWKNKDCPPAKK